MWVAVFIMWMGSTNSVFAPNQIFTTEEMCEDFRKIQHITLEKTKPHEQSGVRGSSCVLVIKGESV